MEICCSMGHFWQQPDNEAIKAESDNEAIKAIGTFPSTRGWTWHVHDLSMHMIDGLYTIDCHFWAYPMFEAQSLVELCIGVKGIYNYLLHRYVSMSKPHVWYFWVEVLYFDVCRWFC